MSCFKSFFLFASFYLVISKSFGQENAAPSIHLSYYFPSNDAILKMQKIKITQSAYASYFEVNWFTKGYAGLQQTPDNSYGNPNILISSLWDPNTAAGVYSTVDYNDSTTFKSRFGGEGDGWKTINPYNWSLNTWYNLVNRSWKVGGRLYVGTFINNLSTGKWVHTATLSMPDPLTYLTGYNDAFLENWDGTNALWNGSFIRKAFFKDCWNINTNGAWEKNTSAYFSANNSAADIQRNGIYHNSFNAFFDNTEGAYLMQHGGNTTRSSAFSGGRTITLPAQANQGTAPTLTNAIITSVTATNNVGTTNVSWNIDGFKAPQLSAKIEIIDVLGNIVKTVQDTLPQRRSYAINGILNNGSFTARVTVRDIFSQLSQPVTAIFIVSGVLPLKLNFFKGLLENNHVTLQWQTSNEINTSFFDIQSSKDGTNFSSISSIQANNGNTGISNYFYSGDLLNLNTSYKYYRLQMFDKDGKNTYSNIIKIESLSKALALSISPNPAKNFITIKGGNFIQVSIVDYLGKTLINQFINNNKTTINISVLSKGIYTVIVTDKDKKIHGEIILIE